MDAKNWLHRLSSFNNWTHGHPGEGVCPVCCVRAAVENTGKCEECKRRLTSSNVVVGTVLDFKALGLDVR